MTSFLQHEKITTTDAKAKELRSIAEKMITLGKKGDLHATRQAAAYIRDKKVVTKLFTTIAPRYADRPGGYTRIIKLGARVGDNAETAMIELVDFNEIYGKGKGEAKEPAKRTRRGRSKKVAEGTAQPAAENQAPQTEAAPTAPETPATEEKAAE